MNKILIAFSFCTQIAFAQSTFIPVTDGTVYSVGAVQTGNFLALGSTTQGILMFAAFDATPYNSISLILNPYGLPVLDSNVNIYGFSSPSATITGDDYNSGTYLGTLVLPSDINYGQLVSFDVTDFIQSTSGPYLGFDLQANGAILSSLEVNYGTPPELIANVPEPSPVVLLFFAGCFISVLQFKRKGVSEHGDV